MCAHDHRSQGSPRHDSPDEQADRGAQADEHAGGRHEGAGRDSEGQGRRGHSSDGQRKIDGLGDERWAPVAQPGDDSSPDRRPDQQACPPGSTDPIGVNGPDELGGGDPGWKGQGLLHHQLSSQQDAGRNANHRQGHAPGPEAPHRDPLTHHHQGGHRTHQSVDEGHDGGGSRGRLGDVVFEGAERQEVEALEGGEEREAEERGGQGSPVDEPGLETRVDISRGQHRADGQPHGQRAHGELSRGRRRRFSDPGRRAYGGMRFVARSPDLRLVEQGFFAGESERKRRHGCAVSARAPRPRGSRLRGCGGRASRADGKSRFDRRRPIGRPR